MQPQKYSLDIRMDVESELRRLSARGYTVQDLYGYLAIGQNNPQWVSEGCLETLKALPDEKMLNLDEDSLYDLVERPSFDKINKTIETVINMADAECWSQIGDQPLYTWIKGKSHTALSGIPGQYARWFVETRLGAY